MTKINFRSCLPYAIALIIFILIAYIYASPVLEGKIINQADISSYQGLIDGIRKQMGNVPVIILSICLLWNGMRKLREKYRI